ncbi:MAG: hypothetical protein J0J01_19005 [Reyranella sp.]|uniref:hypothetical protein n=1 Tax=Reyranella sp. TaxID=1929291 RepID=UPI001ACBEC17|nr:hypothetical protein [Reyranella sp.]MBN9089002.1 hypothetical protein [Reyranella sp.]
MSFDFTKFPYPALYNPGAASRTEAIRTGPVSSGFAVITLKTPQPKACLPDIREFARALREGTGDIGLGDITAYRHIDRDELGGAMPFDQPVCEGLLKAAASREQTKAAAGMVSSLVLSNPRADWVLLVEFELPEQAQDAVAGWREGRDGFDELAAHSTATTIGAFKNMKRYASVSRDPNVIQFFNLFPSPGSVDVVWTAWQDALPWFLEVAEIRSSFPLVALDEEQPILLVNYAHCDSIKHFLIGTLHDPGFREVMESCYARRDVTSPMPFFCKIVPV